LFPEGLEGLVQVLFMFSAQVVPAS